jgi:hypothetical protein
MAASAATSRQVGGRAASRPAISARSAAVISASAATS